uniref:Uncharacterized protein n=1 Tax=Anguilla anguilla TaxID=7936 RepID=A0A0E9PDE6_ANGAN
MKGLPALRTPGSGRSCFFAFEDHQNFAVLHVLPKRKRRRNELRRTKSREREGDRIDLVNLLYHIK